jgi:HEAT repeat protein
MTKHLLPLQAAATASFLAMATISHAEDQPENAKPSAPGFKDVLKDPSLLDDAKEAREAEEKAIADATKASDAQVENAVTDYLFKTTSSREAWGEQKILRSLEKRVQPVILKYLAEKGRYAVWVKPTGKDILSEAPFHRACDLLGDAPPDAAVPLLAPFLNDPDDSIRKEAALAIGKTGSPEIVPHIRKALADPDEYVRSHALMGLSWAAKETKSLRPGVAAELFPDVRRLVEKGENGDEATEILVVFDPAAAKELFLSADFFRADSKILHEALEALDGASIQVPVERLEALIAELSKTKLKYPQEYTLGRALRLLGKHRRPADIELLKSLSTRPEREVAEGASAGLLAWHGLESFDDRLWKLEKEKGYGALKRPQQHYSAVLMFDAEVCNGGLDQYFLNSSGDQWKDALEGLKAMKDNKRADILEKAIAKFGESGPSTEREKRLDQLSALIRKDEASFETLNDNYYDVEPPLEVVMNRYVLDNPDAFR